MIKTLLAGTLLSTGLFSGGAIGAEDIKSEQKVEKSKYSETIERPEGTESKPVFEIGNPEKPEHAKTVEKSEGTESKPVFEMEDPEKSEHTKTVERPEGTDSQEGKNVPTKEGN
ncbi:hypothetical protein SPE26_24525 [Bacillus thuringiensis]|uniref:Alpha-ketoglutarate permease n=1 Tax=Bacillus thuringiensis TaxID=1428 RepID=A0AAW9GRB2_BACTU|nr:hypothetical protein [Bacillus thuringiensis]MDY0853897.1 hypothetical protein [Bacillus thuringiensis]MDY4393861.1 hypothetical protein [Bacillus thuringiensis]MDY7962645.1 hypothetical protein [Bacillus thuringiensis]